MLLEILHKVGFCLKADRIGPDIPFTHWRLYVPSFMGGVCVEKFRLLCENAEFRPGAYAIVCSKISIGKNVVIRPSSMLFSSLDSSIILEDNVMLGSGVQIYVNNHRFDRTDIPIIEQGYYPSKSVLVQEGAWIGANSIILPGVVIGRNAVVGAGSIVTKSIPAHSVAAGNPARVLRTIGK